MKNSVEVQLPGRDRFLVILCMNKSGKQIPSTLLDDVFLDLYQSPAIDGVVSESCTICIPDLTYLVNCSIASRTD